VNYPIIGQVEAADRVQLARWYRFLPSPGSSAVGKPEFHDVATAEAAILNRIIARFAEMGRWTPELSKQVGWTQ